jgi:hypothetical protein
MLQVFKKNIFDLYDFLFTSSIHYIIGHTVRLWSLRFAPEGPAYELWLEQSYVISPEFNKRAEQIPLAIRFY